MSWPDFVDGAPEWSVEPGREKYGDGRPSSPSTNVQSWACYNTDASEGVVILRQGTVGHDPS